MHIFKFDREKKEKESEWETQKRKKKIWERVKNYDQKYPKKSHVTACWSGFVVEFRLFWGLEAQQSLLQKIPGNVVTQVSLELFREATGADWKGLSLFLSC